MPAVPKKKTSTTTKTKTKKKHVIFQALPSRAFRPSPRCAASAGTSTAKRLRKTPRTDAKKCLGSVRIGQDGKYVYIATVKPTRNPKYATSRTRSGGSHLTARWEKLYDARTKKPIKVDDLPSRLFVPR